MTTADESQPGASPARQMLETLALAAKEMTKRIDEAADQALKLNTALESKVEALLAEIAEQYEALVMKQFTGLSVDKDALLGELTEVRREELQILNKLCQELRQELRNQLNQIGPQVKEQAREKLAAYNSTLAETETDVSQSVTLLRMALNENLQEQLKIVAEGASKQGRELALLHSKQHNFLNDESSVNVEKLQVAGKELKDEFKASALNYVKTIQKKVEEISESQSVKLDKQLSEFSRGKEKLLPMLESDMEFADKIPASFAESCNQTAKLRIELHESMASNLNRAYRAEISALAQQTEDKISVLQTQIHLSLSEQLNRYLEQSTELLSQFENSASEAKATIKLEDFPQDASVDAVLDKVKKEVQKSVSDALQQAGQRMEKEVSDLRAKLLLAGQKTSEDVENSFSHYSKKAKEIAQLHNESLDELSSKCDALEQLIGDSRDLSDSLDNLN